MEIPATNIVTKVPNQHLVKETRRREKASALYAWRNFMCIHSKQERMVYIASAFAVMAALASFALSTYLFNANGIQAIILGTLVFAFIAVGAIVIVLLRQFSRDTLRIFAHFARAYPDLAKHIDPLKDREEES